MAMAMVVTMATRHGGFVATLAQVVVLASLHLFSWRTSLLRRSRAPRDVRPASLAERSLRWRGHNIIPEAALPGIMFFQ